MSVYILAFWWQWDSWPWIWIPGPLWGNLYVSTLLPSSHIDDLQAPPKVMYWCHTAVSFFQFVLRCHSSFFYFQKIIWITFLCGSWSYFYFMQFFEEKVEAPSILVLFWRKEAREEQEGGNISGEACQEGEPGRLHSEWIHRESHHLWLPYGKHERP